MSFRFQIGDVVKFKVGDIVTKKTSGIPLPFMVIERITQECHGGVQYKYMLRLDTELLRDVSDFELEAYDTTQGNTP